VGQGRAVAAAIANKCCDMQRCERRYSSDQCRAGFPTVLTTQPTSFPGPVFLICHLAGSATRVQFSSTTLLRVTLKRQSVGCSPISEA
jgi:hypothetical protein